MIRTCADDPYAVDFLVPENGADDVEMAAFHQGTRSLCSNWSRRRMHRGANGWLAQVCYQVLVPYIDHGCIDAIEDTLMAYGRYRKRRNEDLNPFQRGMMALFANPDDAKLITASQRQRTGKAIWYAARHYIPAPLLTGFLTQVGVRRLMEVDEEDLEFGFDEWIAQCRARNPGDDAARGRYCSEINARANQIASLLVDQL